jgi:hypothetical protein
MDRLDADPAAVSRRTVKRRFKLSPGTHTGPVRQGTATSERRARRTRERYAGGFPAVGSCPGLRPERLPSSA